MLLGCLQRDEHKEMSPSYRRERDQGDFVTMQSFPCWRFLHSVPKGLFLTHLMSLAATKRYHRCWPTVHCAGVFSHQLSIQQRVSASFQTCFRIAQRWEIRNSDQTSYCSMCFPKGMTLAEPAWTLSSAHLITSLFPCYSLSQLLMVLFFLISFLSFLASL